MYGEYLRYSFDLNRWFCFLLPCPVFFTSTRPGTATMKPSAPEPRRTTTTSHGSPEAPGERGAPPRAGEAVPSSPLAPAGRTSTRASTRTTPAEGGCGRCCGRKGEGDTYALLYGRWLRGGSWRFHPPPSLRHSASSFRAHGEQLSEVARWVALASRVRLSREGWNLQATKTRCAVLRENLSPLARQRATSSRPQPGTAIPADNHRHPNRQTFPPTRSGASCPRIPQPTRYRSRSFFACLLSYFSTAKQQI